MHITPLLDLSTLLLLGAFICALFRACAGQPKAAFAAAALLARANQALVQAPAQKAFRSNHV